LKDFFATLLLDWFDEHGRKDLPWQADSDPYKIWLSEVMLQQTQVATVIPYFQRFIERFPNVYSLAEAEQDEVLHLWSGLGYYARGRNLHAAAKRVMVEFDGIFPDDIEGLQSLKGVGRSTAGAIRAQAFGLASPILDGNVKRVLSRLIGLKEWPGTNSSEAQLWALSETLLPETRLRDYTQAIMDLGATLCTRSKPSCLICPFASSCEAKKQSMQAQIPFRKPKKQKPIREKIFLVLANEYGELLLQKRPESGIWGGLWSFLEIDDDPLTLANEVAKYTEQDIDEANWLDSGKHIFSHFQLNYRPIYLQVNRVRVQQINEGEELIWYRKYREKTYG